MRLFKTICVLALVGTLSSGCATLFNGTSDRVRIVSDPSGAEVYVDGVREGVTPLNKSFASKYDHQVVLRKEGYKDAAFEMNQAPNIAFFFNVLFLPGFIVDLLTERHWDIDPTEYSAKLEKE